MCDGDWWSGWLKVNLENCFLGVGCCWRVFFWKCSFFCFWGVVPELYVSMGIVVGTIASSMLWLLATGESLDVYWLFFHKARCFWACFLRDIIIWLVRKLCVVIKRLLFSFEKQYNVMFYFSKLRKQMKVFTIFLKVLKCTDKLQIWSKI